MFPLTFACALLVGFFPPAGEGPLQVEITNVRNTKGVIRVGLFQRAEGFPDQGQVYWGKSYTPGPGKMMVEIPGLPYGDYALAIFHDLNANGKLDRNMLGIPTEPYGFSGGAKAKWSAPDFEDARFSFTSNGLQQRIALFLWEEW